MSVVFKKEVLDEFEIIANRYPTRRAALLPALWLAQREFGYLSLEVLDYIAQIVKISPVQVYEVAEFYTLFHKKPVGKYHLQVCRTISCALNGALDIQRAIEAHLHTKPGEITHDKLFSYELVECLASCHTAPCMRINEDYYENLSPEKVNEILNQLVKENNQNAI
jgi:NADH-quinone oxidoreductase E subunit